MTQTTEETKAPRENSGQTKESKLKDVPAPIAKLFEVGAHYGNTQSSRHPSTARYIFGVKNTVVVFDLDKTHEALERAKTFLEELGAKGKQVFFVSSKREARDAVVGAAQKLSMPYVINRWVGGTLTNFDEIKKRADRLETLKAQKEAGELGKYTKHEQLLITREIEDLEQKFGGRTVMKRLPATLVVVDPKHEAVAVAEAKKLDIPIVALAGSDCDVSHIAYPIPANDSSIEVISYIVSELAQAYQNGTAAQPAEKEVKKETEKEA